MDPGDDVAESAGEAATRDDDAVLVIRRLGSIIIGTGAAAVGVELLG